MNNKFEKKAFIVQNNNKSILKESTAGGAFTSISKQVIENKGVVFGCTLDKKFRAIHVEANSVEELLAFRNSKYVQSYLGDTFKKVKQYVEMGKLVCFSGTPCQIEGLRNYLRKEYDNLILVDVCCRAVPSPGVWKRYLSEVINKDNNLKSVRFRDKDFGYQYSTMKEVYESKIVREGIESDYWLRMFFSGTITRPSCSNCKFRRYERNSDITIWDCLNLHDYKTCLDETVGATRVIAQSLKGLEYINSIRDAKVVEIPIVDAIKNVNEFNESPKTSDYRSNFWKDYSSYNMEELLKKYYPITFKIKFIRLIRRLLNIAGLDVYIKRIIRHN